jgi:glyoxylase-like metal-dependent hydrolase (beta-lactamase superfamily II)
MSHLHCDHCGGLVDLPNARLLVQRPEWDAAFDEGLVEYGVFNPGDFDLGHERELLDGERDVFGDGSVRLVPTPGHTHGHQSLLVEDRLLLVADACYCRLALDLDATPPFGADLDEQRKTFAWLRRKEAAGVELVFSHDPAQWRPWASCSLTAYGLPRPGLCRDSLKGVLLGFRRWRGRTRPRSGRRTMKMSEEREVDVVTCSVTRDLIAGDVHVGVSDLVDVRRYSSRRPRSQCRSSPVRGRGAS